MDGQPTRTYFHWLALAYYVTLTGHPAVSLPVGLDEKGFPFGLQIVGYRPSPGLVPHDRKGHGWSPLGVLGPMARDV
ncbi:MAG: amidase family protein, partial [Rubritepida sp.]|nr:amidase family protein [Rubritepida sp.]